MLAALLAARGFTASTTVIEADQGFAAIAGAHADASAALAGPESGWHLRDNLFKYHASCFFTHSMIEGLCDLRRDESVGPSEIEQVTVHVSELQLGTCVIAEPRTGLEVKFSMAHLAAMTLLGRSTSRITDADANDAEVIALRGRVVLTHDATPGDPTHVELALRDGRRLDARHDVNKPADDLDTQGRRLAEKFTRLAEPVLGVDRAEALLRALTVLDASSSVRELMALSRG
jgi:2-methylcitrate dehydratase PrpD